MALIQCPECGREISDKSKACVHCGYPLAELWRPEVKTYKVILVSVGAQTIQCVTIIRRLLDTTLTAALAITRNLPYTLQENLSHEAAVAAQNEFAAVGAIAVIQECGTNQSK